mmetsp:Transcript_11928/g.24016  ORF Transcript_11928/g.24016 Transcript_11928/m.24016 type:complete len:1379 (-) Transcript_11928:50-4186(-)
MKCNDNVMEGDHHWNYQQQALASILFDKNIDPIVRRLIILDDLRRQTQQQRNDNYVAAAPRISSSSELGLELERRNQVKHLLHTLRIALYDIMETVTVKNDEINNNSSQNDEVGNEDAKNYWQSRVQNQINGIAVPLFSLLRQHQPRQLHNSNNDDGRLHYILQSAAYSCMEEAALIVIVVWKCRQNIVNISGKCKDGESNDNDINSLVLPGLVSCTMALSSLDIANNGDSIGDQNTINSDETALDRGEECAVALLRCMQAFLTSSSPSSTVFDLDSLPSVLDQLQHLASPMATEIGDAMGGALVARLVQTCLALLPKESENKEASNNNNTNKNNPTLQLEALKTLQLLMTSIPIDTLWKAILPGCFAGLYRCALSKLRYSSSASTHKVASEAILALSLLLVQSMKNTNTIGRSNESNNHSVTETLFAVIQKSKLAVETQDLTEGVSDQSSVQSSHQDLAFDNEVNARLPGPLSILLSLVSTNRSHLVRQRGLFLCRIILVDTRSTWTESTSITLGKKAMEYCLTALTDENDKLSDYSLQVLSEYKSQLGAIEWKRRLSQNTVPTILELVEMLPILAKSGRDVEVRNYLRIIDGYLLISFRGEKNLGANQTKHRSLGKGKSNIGAALSCVEAAKVIKEAFSVIFAPDTESMTRRPVIEAFSADGNEVGIIGDHSRLRFLYLQDETINAARQTARLFARTFGTKRCAFIIDACIADMFESCSRRCQLRHTPGGISAQLTWSGSCVYCTELLEGLMKLDEYGDKDRATKNAKRTAHVLSSLAASVFPIIVSDPLWTLSTTLDGHGSEQKTQTKPNGLRVAMVDSIGGDSICEASSITVMNANAILLCALMGFVCQFARVLDEDIKLHLPTIILPLLERASGIGNHSYVQNFAVASLGVISKSTACSDMYSFIATNFDYLLDAVSIRVRKHAKERSTMSRCMMGVIDVVLRSAIRHGSITSSARLSMVDHMLTCLLNYFDRQYDVSMSQQNYFDTVCVFRSIISFVDESVIEQTGNITPFMALKSNDQEGNDWLQRLDDELQLGPTGNSESDEDTINEPNTEEDESSKHTDDNDDHIVENKSIKHMKEIHTVNAVLARCSYLVCSENLKIQVMGCETILAGFSCLWKIGDFRTSQQGESASNPLLPAIAELWPTIIRRLRAASSAHISSRRRSRHRLPIRHAMAKDQDQSKSQTSLEALISKCLEIISQLCTLSDGFFSNRFENDVYPILARLLESDDRGNILLEDGRHSHYTKRHSLLLSVLVCLKHTFESSCGRDLAGLIPSCGSMIFPMLSDDNVSGAAVETIKAMLKVDSDALWRGLHKLSGRSFPRNPLRVVPPCSTEFVSPSGSKLGFDKDVCMTTKQNAERLLDFLDTLPEQHL